MTSADRLRIPLLHLHKALIEAERREHEKTLGRLSDRDFLEALIRDPAFGWLAPLTGLIARLDEMAEEGADALDPRPIRELLSAGESDFQRRYAGYLQRSPEVLVAHGEVLRALKRPA